MAYLLDAVIFVIVVFGLIGLDLCFWSTGRSTAENLLLPAGLFFGGYALLVWLCGSLGPLVPGLWIILPWPLLLALLAVRRKNVAAGVPRLLTSLRSWSLEEYLLLGYLAAIGLLAFALCLAPPNGADYDSLVYHLAAPAQYLRHGRVVELPYDHHSYFPFTMEMWFMLGLAAKGPVLAKLFHWLMLPTGALALAAMGSRYLSRRAGLWAAALYVTIPMVIIEATTAYIDLGFTAFALLAVLCILRGMEGNSTLWLAASGAFCGFAMGCKYLGGLFFIFFGASLVVSGLLRRSFNLKHLAAFAIPALLLGLPWYLRNWAWTGNPVYPFAYGVFGGKGWTAEMAKSYYADQAKFGFGKTPLDIAWLPWRLAMSPLNAGQPFWPLNNTIPVRDGKNGYFEVLGLLVSVFPGPVWLALGAPAFFIPRKKTPLVLCLSLVAFLWIFWMFTSQQVRYLLPAFALLSLAGAWTLHTADNSMRFAPRVIRAALIAWMAFVMLFFIRQGGSAWQVVSGAVKPGPYLTRAFSGYGAMNWASTGTPPGARFAVYGEPRCYYLDRDYFWADDAHNNLIDYSTITDGAKLVAALRAQGATHVLCNLGTNNGGFGGLPPHWDEAVNQGLIVQLFEFRGYTIFVLR